MILLYGLNRVALKEKEKKIINYFKRKYSSIVIKRFFDDTPLEFIKSEILEKDIFLEKKIIILVSPSKECLDFLNSKRESLFKDPTLLLIFEEPNTENPSHSFYKFLAQKKRVFSFDIPRGEKLEKFILALFKKEGVEVVEEVVSILSFLFKETVEIDGRRKVIVNLEKIQMLSRIISCYFLDKKNKILTKEILENFIERASYLNTVYDILDSIFYYRNIKNGVLGISSVSHFSLDQQEMVWEFLGNNIASLLLLHFSPSAFQAKNLPQFIKNKLLLLSRKITKEESFNLFLFYLKKDIQLKRGTLSLPQAIFELGREVLLI